MNTIPTTFNAPGVSYTVIGGKKKKKTTHIPPELSVLLLNRGKRLFKEEVLTGLEKFGNCEILSVEGSGQSYEVEILASQHPRVRFLVFQDPVSLGKQINTGIEETHGKFILVIWNDMKLPPGTSPDRLVERLKKQNTLCMVPLIQNHKFETIPTMQIPAFQRNKLKMVALPPKADGMSSLFPSDFAGVYCKEKFILSGGFDHTITHPYWQKMDFGFRTHMWGESILCDTSFRIQYLEHIPTEDTTPDRSYKLFFLKNLCIRFQGDTGSLPWSRYIHYLTKSGTGIFEAFQEFRQVRSWVEINKYRFKQDARSVTELWEIPEI